MTEFATPPEKQPSSTPILDLSRSLGTHFTEESEQLLSALKPRMADETKATAYSAFIDSIQQAEDEAQQASPQSDVRDEARRHIGIVLATAHAHYAMESTWPDMSEELWNAFDMADQNGDSYPEFFDLKEEIYAVIKDLAQKQYRL